MWHPETIVFTERYQQLHKIARTIIEKLTPNGIEVLVPLLQDGGGLLRLELDRVCALLPETASPEERDHLLRVYLATIESYLFRHGYCATGQIIKVMSCNYGVLSEEEKQATIRGGFPCLVMEVSSAEELDACTPLNDVTDAEYSTLYEKLVAGWGKPTQKDIAARMNSRLATIHDLLPRHKIGDGFRRERNGREEPLPLYVRNEIHHPTKDGRSESAEFRKDKRIGYAIMEVWSLEQ